MTATLAQPKVLTFLEFLEIEQKSEVKHEFHKGKLKEMAGGTQRHNAMALNVGAFLKICIMKMKIYLNEYKIFNQTLMQLMMNYLKTKNLIKTQEQ